MSKVTEFYKAAIEDEAAKQEINTILGQANFGNASDEQLEKIGEVAKKLGFDITLEEAKEYLNGKYKELDNPELSAVANGKVVCNAGVGVIN